MKTVALSANPQPGEILLGRYRIERVLGAGGMGQVVAARHLDLDSLVAIKFLLPEVLQNSEVVARFAREARAAAKIKSEHVARVTDVGTLPGGAPYMVMEFLEGSDLAEFVRARGPLPEKEAVDFLLQALEAIAEAHKAGIVHRDLKPANLFLSRRVDGSELVKVLDFGISKMTETSGSGPSGNMTNTSALLGSPVYMSPEQLTSSRDVDVRTDIWALGVILYELLCGRLPFQADSVPQLCVTILQTEPLPLSSMRPDVSPGLEAVIARCIQKDRERRYATVGDLAHALRDFAGPASRLSIERILRILPPRTLDATQAMPEAKGPGQGQASGATVLLPTGKTGSAGGTISYPGQSRQTADRTQPAARRRGGFGVAVAVGVVAVVGALVAYKGLQTPAPLPTPAGTTRDLAAPQLPAAAQVLPAPPVPPPTPPPQAVAPSTEGQQGVARAVALPTQSATAAQSTNGASRRRHHQPVAVSPPRASAALGTVPRPTVPTPGSTAPPPPEGPRARSTSEWETDRN